MIPKGEKIAPPGARAKGTRAGPACRPFTRFLPAQEPCFFCDFSLRRVRRPF
jgi:hypothetical protein